MISRYNADERIIEGVKDLLIDNMNEYIRSHNAEYEDSILINEISSENVYSDYVTVQQIMSRAFRFPAICFYIESSDEIEKNIAISFQNIQLKFAIFTDGENGATIIKRYLSALRDLLATDYKDIDSCIFKLGNPRWRYFTPIKYQSDELRIAELDVQVVVEVRK